MNRNLEIAIRNVEVQELYSEILTTVIEAFEILESES